MSKKHGLDKYLKPHGFWDHFITCNVVAIFLLSLHWMNFSNGVVDGMYFAGLLIGLFSGQVAICIAEIARAKPEIRESLRPIYLVLTVGIFFVFIFLFSSARLAVAFVFGLGITLGFGWALIALMKRLNKTGTSVTEIQRDTAENNSAR